MPCSYVLAHTQYARKELWLRETPDTKYHLNKKFGRAFPLPTTSQQEIK